MTDGRPYDFVNIAFKAELLLAGYAVVSMDFRGTGKTLCYNFCLGHATQETNIHIYSAATPTSMQADPICATRTSASNSIAACAEVGSHGRSSDAFVALNNMFSMASLLCQVPHLVSGSYPGGP